MRDEREGQERKREMIYFKTLRVFYSIDTPKELGYTAVAKRRRWRKSRRKPNPWAGIYSKFTTNCLYTKS